MIIIKKYFKYLGLIGICLLSFYYTEKVALYTKNRNPIMKSINAAQEKLNYSYINSTIIDDLYIIPGRSGREINLDRSFYNMQEKNSYDEEKIVFNEIKPTISIEDNKDKIIIRGNKEKRSVALLFESSNDLTKYLNQNSYIIDILLTKEEYNLSNELINNANTEKTYYNIENYLTKNKINHGICIILNDKVPSLCQNKYLVKPSLTISHSNISTEKNKIDSGEIILVKDSLTLSELEILLNQIKYKDLNIVPLSQLIME